MNQPLKADLKRVLAMARPARDFVLLEELVASVLKSSARLPDLPHLAAQYAERLADRVRDPKGHHLDSDADARERLKHWERWYAQVKEALVVDGVGTLRQLERAGWRKRFDSVAERLDKQVRVLRELALPWWPTFEVEDSPWRELSLLDWTEREIGRLTTRMIRRGGDRQSPVHPPQRRDVGDPISLDDWEPLKTVGGSWM